MVVFMNDNSNANIQPVRLYSHDRFVGLQQVLAQGAPMLSLHAPSM